MSAKVSSLVRSWVECEQLDSCLVTFSGQNKCMMISLCFMSPFLYMEEAAMASIACNLS